MRARAHGVLLSVLVAAAAGCGEPGGEPGGDAGVDAAPLDPSAELYDPDRVPTFAIELPEASVAALTADPRTYVRGTLRYGAEVVPDIGVRLKGEWNFRPLGEKAPFKLKFDEFVPGQRFRGLKRMTFNNALEDHSWVAERVTYAVFRDADLPAPRANAALVTVNGAAYGVYVNVETEDKQLLGRWFPDDSGNLYEELGVELEPGNEDGFDLETNATTPDRGDLTALFAAIAGARDASLLADIGAILDGDAFVRYCAYEGAVSQWDGYCFTRFDPNNFRLYHDPSRGFVFLPWGMDMAWKPYDGDTVVVTDARGLLLRRCLAGADCRARYGQALRAAADRLEALALPTLVDRWGRQVRALVDADPMKETDLAGFDATLAVVRAQVAARPGELRAQAP